MMNTFIDFVLQYHQLIAIVIALMMLVVLAIWAWKNGYKRNVQLTVLFLVVQAEKQLGSKTGELKYATVVTWLYDRMPTLLRIFFTKKDFVQLIEAAVSKLKFYLENDINLLSYSDEELLKLK